MVKTWIGTCTACGKKETLVTGDDPNKTGRNLNNSHGCPNTKDKKHIVIWTPK